MPAHSSECAGFICLMSEFQVRIVFAYLREELFDLIAFAGFVFRAGIIYDR